MKSYIIKSWNAYYLNCCLPAMLPPEPQSLPSRKVSPRCPGLPSLFTNNYTWAHPILLSQYHRQTSYSGRVNTNSFIFCSCFPPCSLEVWSQTICRAEPAAGPPHRSVKTNERELIMVTVIINSQYRENMRGQSIGLLPSKKGLTKNNFLQFVQEKMHELHNV